MDSPIFHLGAMNGKGELVDPVAVAKRLAGLLGETRMEGSASRRQPLGELVSVNVELVGLRGRPVFLLWSIFQKSGQTRLYGKWLSDFVAYRFEATADDATATQQMWIPLPKVPGPYLLHLSLIAGTTLLADAWSDPFG